MKVKELKELLADLPDDMLVIMQADGEGNGYSPLSGGDADCVYVADSAWSGEVYSTDREVEDPDSEMGDEDWEEIQSAPRALVLYPVN